MKFRLFPFLLFILCASAIDPQIPTDKCGLSATNNQDGTVALFILGSDKSFYYKSELESGEYANWTSMGGQFKSGPAVVRSDDGRLEVFGRATDNTILHKYQLEPNSDQWTEKWLTLGTTKLKFSSNPVPILSSEGFVHLFARNMEGSLMHKTQFTNRTLFVWTEWASLGGSLTSHPTVMLDAEGLIHAFARGPDRALWHKHQVGGQEPRFVKWSEWKSLGGVIASSPFVPITLNTVNLLELFVRASDKSFWHRCQVASLPPNQREVEWNEWQSLGGVFSSGPAALVNSEGLIETYGRGADKAVWRKSQFLLDGTPRWSNWVSLKGITSAGPTISIGNDGLVRVFARGVDKQIWLKTQHRGSNTTEFALWRSLDNSVLAEAFSC